MNINEHKLVSLDLNIQQVNTQLSQNNVNVPGGQLDEGETRYLIRTLNEFQSLEEIASIAIVRKDGVDIRLRLVRPSSPRSCVDALQPQPCSGPGLRRLVFRCDVFFESSAGTSPSCWCRGRPV